MSKSAKGGAKDSAKDLERAQATFDRKEAQAREGQTAMAEYLADIAAERKKTERLRALRLAKEEADRQAAAVKAAAAAAKAAAAQPKPVASKAVVKPVAAKSIAPKPTVKAKGKKKAR